LKLVAMRDEVGKEDWSLRGMKWLLGLKLKDAMRVEGWRWRLGHVIKQKMETEKAPQFGCYRWQVGPTSLPNPFSFPRNWKATRGFAPEIEPDAQSSGTFWH
jgi:hypothetical protein